MCFRETKNRSRPAQCKKKGGGGMCSKFSCIKAADEDKCEPQRRCLVEESSGDSDFINRCEWTRTLT